MKSNKSLKDYRTSLTTQCNGVRFFIIYWQFRLEMMSLDLCHVVFDSVVFIAQWKIYHHDDICIIAVANRQLHTTTITTNHRTNLIQTVPLILIVKA